LSTNSIVQLEPEHQQQLKHLLQANNLPYQDCADHLQHFCGIFNQGELIATGGLEFAGENALLRSIVVSVNHRSKGLAGAISNHLLEKARARGITALYLLTETAESYFAAIGFCSIARKDVPEAIRNTQQFETLCPADASCLVRKL
jgi:amino-acid N-acetyltransferase